MYLVVLLHGEDEAAGGELPQDGDLGGRHVPQLVVLRLLRRTQNTDNTQRQYCVTARPGNYLQPWQQ